MAKCSLGCPNGASTLSCLAGRWLAQEKSAEVDSPYPCGLRGSTRLVLGCGGTRFAGPAEMRDLSPAISWIEPVLKSDLEPLEHLLFDVFDVSELGPTSKITAFRRTLDLYDKLFHQLQLVRVFFPQMLFANVSSLSLSMLGP